MLTLLALCYTGGMKDDRTGTIYMLTAPSGKRYVGLTTRFERRMADYRQGGCRGQRALHPALKKYGFDSFSVTKLMVGIVTVEAMNACERAFIVIMGSSTEKGGYNCTDGGGFERLNAESVARRTMKLRGQKRSAEFCQACSDRAKGRKHTEAQKAKVSAALKGRKMPAHAVRKMVHTKNQPEFKQRLSAKMSGKNNPFFGRKHSPETCAKMSEAATGRKASPATRAKMSAAQKARHARTRQQAPATQPIPTI